MGSCPLMHWAMATAHIGSKVLRAVGPRRNVCLKQTFRLGPTAPASLPPAVLLLPRVLQCQDDPSWLGGRTPGSAQKHSTKFSTQSQTLCHLPTSEASPPKTSSPPSIGSTTEQKPRWSQGRACSIAPKKEVSNYKFRHKNCKRHFRIFRGRGGSVAKSPA